MTSRSGTLSHDTSSLDLAKSQNFQTVRNVDTSKINFIPVQNVTKSFNIFCETNSEKLCSGGMHIWCLKDKICSQSCCVKHVSNSH